MIVHFKNNWWLLTLNGVIAVLFGVFALFIPQATILTIAKYFGFILLLGGLILFIGALSKMKKKKSYGVLLIEGIISLVIGFIILFFTKQTLELFVILIGIWAITLGIFQLSMLIGAKAEGMNKTVVLINGLITLLFGILIFFNPFQAAVGFTYIVGIIALIFGIIMIYISFKLKNLQNIEKNNGTN